MKMDLYTKLRNKPIIFKRICGITTYEFEKIIKKIESDWYKHINAKQLLGRPYGLDSIEAHLLCLLIYYRTYTTQMFISLLFKVDTATICRSIKRLEPILAKNVSIKKCRSLKQEELETLIVDATEQKIHRPVKNQKKYYSGKKRKHTIKTEIMINAQGRIVEISKPFPGSIHDFAVRKKSANIPKDSLLLGDSGYQGIESYHKKSKVPIKKKRKRSLDEASKKANQYLSKARIYVEHKIRELKIFRIIGGVYRNFKRGYGIKMNIVAGIVNIKNGF